MLRNKIAEFDDPEAAENEEDGDFSGIKWPTQSKKDVKPSKVIGEAKKLVLIDLAEEKKPVGVQNSFVIETKWTRAEAEKEQPWEEQPIKTKATTG